jgi:hypothetical protein
MLAIVHGMVSVFSELKEAFRKAKERNVWTFIIGLMVIRIILFI